MDLQTLPPLDVLQTALRKTTETLVESIVTPAGTAPLWSELEWRIAEAAVAIQGIAALLAVPWRGPARWESFLDGQRLHTRLRRQRVTELLTLLDSHARWAGVPMVALKGSALYGLGLYPRSDRPMSDIDLLVSDRDEPAATKVIVDALGYRPGLAKARHRVFEPQEAGAPVGFGEHAGNPIKIELHTRIAEPLPLSGVEITSSILPASAAPGINPYPSTAALMRHLLLHAAGSIRGRALRFVQLHDIALLAGRMCAADWDELLHEDASRRGAWWAFAPMALTARYYPGAIPRRVLQAAMRGCPGLLKRATARHTIMEVSWAKLRIQAFPGIEWASSPADALGYMLSRIFPDRQALRELRDNAACQAYAAAVPWFALSHVQRIVRWVFSNPPRVQGIHAIRAALYGRAA